MKSAGVRGRISRVANAKLFVLIVTNFADMVGLLMIIPLMPFYARELGGGALVVSILMSSFTAAQLLSAPLWGRFSDKYGRRPALLIGLTAAGIAYVVFAFAHTIWLLLLSRVVQGAGGGTVGVIQATSPTPSSRRIAPRRWAGCRRRPMSASPSGRRSAPALCGSGHAGRASLLRPSA